MLLVRAAAALALVVVVRPVRLELLVQQLRQQAPVVAVAAACRQCNPQQQHRRSPGTRATLLAAESEAAVEWTLTLVHHRQLSVLAASEAVATAGAEADGYDTHLPASCSRRTAGGACWPRAHPWSAGLRSPWT